MAEKRAWSWVDGEWLPGNPKIAGPLTHAMWLSSIVFDGARAFEGTTPDLDRHCQRVVESAKALGLAPKTAPGEILELCRDGVAKFEPGAPLYIRPMFFAEEGWVDPDPDSTRFVLSVYDSPLPPETGFSAILSSKRRPTPETAPTMAKASGLYPQSGLALQEAKARGAQNAVMLDALGHVSEFATANIMFGKDGAVHTPVWNGSFLNGITRNRVIGLLRKAGVTVHERTIRPHEVLEADEIFSTGNHGKVLPVTRYEDRDFQPGPMYTRARELYWEFAHSA